MYVAIFIAILALALILIMHGYKRVHRSRTLLGLYKKYGNKDTSSEERAGLRIDLHEILKHCGPNKSFLEIDKLALDLNIEGWQLIIVAVTLGIAAVIEFYYLHYQFM
ncbi:MAG: hypothetical protein WCP24_02350 [bacterium]